MTPYFRKGTPYNSNGADPVFDRPCKVDSVSLADPEPELVDRAKPIDSGA